MALWGRRRRGSDGRDEYIAAWAGYEELYESGDVAATRAFLTGILERFPDAQAAWFDLGLFAKRERDWARCADYNQRALAQVRARGDTRESPEAWNLGIAATGLRDWRLAREAWAAYGITVPGSGDAVVEGDFGLTPVRLNPEPRHPGETDLVLDGETHPAEVVWCQRLCPARARIDNVPMPESGHHWGDIVLHDGEPVGERQLDDQVRPVFNELALWEPSEVPTLQGDVVADQAGVEALGDAMVAAGGQFEPLNQIRMLCRACSEGLPDNSGEHDHDSLGQADGRVPVLIALKLERARAVIADWSESGAGRVVESLEQVL